MKLTAVLLISLLCLVTQAKEISFTACGGIVVKVQKLDVNPYPVVKGQKVNLTISGNAAKEISGGKISADIKYGLLNFPQELNVCAVTTCPIPAGGITLSYSVNVPKILPSGKYHLKISIKDENAELLTCIELDFKLADG